MDSLETDIETGILEACEPPCLSLYQRTHRHAPENQQDPIRFAGLVDVLQASLRQTLTKRETEGLLEPFRALARDGRFWRQTLDGLAVLGGSDLFRTYRLQRPVTDFAVVADRLQLKPLLRAAQTSDRYQVLALSRRTFRLFEGDRDVLDEVEPDHRIPRDVTEALGEAVTESHLTVASYGGTGGESTPMVHGHGGKRSGVGIDEERFFRVVDRGVLEFHSRPSGLPLVLATLPEHRRLFHRLSRNPFLTAEGVDADPGGLTIDELRERAWHVMERRSLARLAALSDEFGAAKAAERAHDELAPVAVAIVAGRVETLLVEADRQVPGRVDAATGDVEPGELSDAASGDILDQLGLLARRTGTEVVVLPAERMPTDSGVAAILRY
jgi:hypothetical protein